MCYEYLFSVTLTRITGSTVLFPKDERFGFKGQENLIYDVILKDSLKPST